ncbi:hypothetical protein OJF2_79150 (plasmid) [Aquisphaera giovannonii]|uniref:DUF883 domain-containing protein n=1 Tax=Aquisphaera giovannonii TaxID=406548 RepID=A0A5B9WHQ8_9BACT|nr:hypothetical protein OJF2_79150 [Aquisphaera giovannonii]
MSRNLNPPRPRAAAMPPGDAARGTLGEIAAAVGPIRQTFEQAIGDHPLRAAAVSLAVGVLLGWLIKR